MTANLCETGCPNKFSLTSLLFNVKRRLQDPHQVTVSIRMYVSAIINARVVSQKTSLLSNRNSGAEQHFVNMEVKTWPFEVMQSGHEREICLITITAVLFGTNEGELFWRVILKHRHVLVWVCFAALETQQLVIHL